MSLLSKLLWDNSTQFYNTQKKSFFFFLTFLFWQVSLNWAVWFGGCSPSLSTILRLLLEAQRPRHHFLFLWSITRQYFLNQTLVYLQFFSSFYLTFLTQEFIVLMRERGSRKQENHKTLICWAQCRLVMLL